MKIGIHEQIGERLKAKGVRLEDGVLASNPVPLTLYLPFSQLNGIYENLCPKRKRI